MKKALILAMVVLLLGASYVLADDGATVIKEFGCLILAQDSGLATTLFTDKSQAVVTPSGNATLTCQFDIPEALLPDKTLQNSGFACVTYLGPTYDSKSVATKGGKVILSCHINPSSN